MPTAALVPATAAYPVRRGPQSLPTRAQGCLRSAAAAASLRSRLRLGLGLEGAARFAPWRTWRTLAVGTTGALHAGASVGRSSTVRDRFALSLQRAKRLDRGVSFVVRHKDVVVEVGGDHVA